ncbi:importin-5-like [Capsicum chacoense]
MATVPETAKRLFEPDPYSLISLLYLLRNDNDNLRKPAKNLLDYTIKNYPNSLVHKLSEIIQLESSITRVLCYDLLRDILQPLWTKLTFTTRNAVKICLNYKIWLEKDYGTLKACFSCVSRLACLILPKKEWDILLYFMLRNLGSRSWNRKMAALFLWDALIANCPDAFMLYVDRLIVGFKDVMVAASDDHRFGVFASKASVKLIMCFATPASYCKFYDLFAYVMMVLVEGVHDLFAHKIMASYEGVSEEEEIVCSLLEDLIVLAGVETAFFEVKIGVVIECMVRIAEDMRLREKLRQLAIEFVVTVAEDRECGCRMMQMVPNEEVAKLVGVLIVMLAYIEDDPSWGNANSDDGNEGVLSMCSYAMVGLNRLAVALGGSVIVPSCHSCLSTFLGSQEWRGRHAAVTAIGLISEGCSKALLLEMEKLVETIVNLIHDEHPRVRWATIHAIGQLSKYMSPHFQEQYHHQLLPALIQVLDDFDNPRLQTQATSALLLFSHNCSSDVLKLYLHKIVNKLVVFLQRGMPMTKEAALATLATLTISSQEDSASIYNSVTPFLKVIMVTTKKDTSHMLLAKALECSTMITMAVGNLGILDYVEKVIEALISLQETQTEVEDPTRSLLLQAWGRLCKGLGADFLPYLNIVMPFVLKSVRLTSDLGVSNSSDTDDSDDGRLAFHIALKCMCRVLVLRMSSIFCSKLGITSAVLEEKALACHMLCCFAAELKEGLHFWVNEVISVLVPMLTSKFSRVRTAAISAMPLLLQSAASAMKKRLPVTGCSKPPLQNLFDTIIKDLLEALKTESKIQIQATLLEALNGCIQIPSSRLSEQQATDFVDGILEVLSTCSYYKTAREEAEEHLTICRNVGICLGTMVIKYKADFLPLFDKFLPYASLMWSNDRTAEERRIVVHIFRTVAEQCREEAFRYYEEWIPLLLKVYDHKNPDVQELVATAIGICAEFGGDFLKPHTAVIFSYFKSVMEHPDAKLPDNITAYEAAVSACGKLCQFVSEGIYTYEFIHLWLYNLPIMCNLDEAKINHEQLCSMTETSADKVTGPQGLYIPQIITIFAECPMGREQYSHSRNYRANDQTIEEVSKGTAAFHVL